MSREVAADLRLSPHWSRSFLPIANMHWGKLQKPLIESSISVLVFFYKFKSTTAPWKTRLATTMMLCRIWLVDIAACYDQIYWKQRCFWTRLDRRRSGSHSSYIWRFYHCGFPSSETHILNRCEKYILDLCYHFLANGNSFVFYDASQFCEAPFSKLLILFTVPDVG